MKRKMCKRLLALWVIFCLMFSSLPLYAVVTDDAMVDANTVLPIADDSMAQLKSSLSPVMPNLNEYVLSEGDLTTEELKKTTLSMEDIPEVMRNEDFDASFHVNRLYEQEEDLNTVIFQNVDGTKTMYMYPFDVKYEDEKGVVLDKSVSMIQTDYLAGMEILSQTINDLYSDGNSVSVASFTPPVIDHDGQLDNGIHDVAILESLPEFCTGGAYRTYMGAHRTFGRTKTFVRFPYLVTNNVFERISEDQIISANYKVYKAQASASLSFNVYWYTGTYWNESTANFTTPSDIHSYSAIAGTSAQSVPAAEGWVNIDITKAVLGWKNGTHDVSKGLVMFSSSLPNYDSGQTFYSVEGGLYDGGNVPRLIISWRPEQQVTIQDGHIFAIKNENTKYLTANNGPVPYASLENKINVYYEGTNNIDNTTQGPAQLWHVTSVDGEVYKIRSVGISDNVTWTDGYVLSAEEPGTSDDLDTADVVLKADSSDDKSKWIIQEYNGDLYIINYGMPEYFLAVQNGNAFLSKARNNVEWTFEKKQVLDIMEDLVINHNHKPTFNFIVEESAIVAPYSMNVFKTGIEEWDGLAYVNVNVYRAGSSDIGIADYTVYIRGVQTSPYINKNSDYAVTLINPIIDDDLGELAPTTIEILINLQKLPGTTQQAKKIATHEAGHALFLNHPHQNRENYYPASVMNQGNLGVTNVTISPSWYDVYNLRKRWG